MPAKLLLRFRKTPSLIFLYLIVLIPVLTMCYFLISDYSHLEQEEVKKNEQMARLLAENLDSYLASVKATLTSISTLSPVQNKERTKIEAIFENLMLADGNVSLYWASGTDGNVIAKYPNLWPDKRDNAFIDEVLKRPGFVSEPRKGTISGIEVITVSTLIKDGSGNVKGAIGASIPLEKIRQRLLLKVGKTGYPILVTKKGSFLVHPQREVINKKIGPDDPITQTIQKGGSGTLDIVAPFDNQRKFFSYVPLKEADWIVLVIQPLSEFHAQTLQFVTRNVVIIVLAIFLVVLAAYYLILFREREEDNRILAAEKLSIVGQLAAGMAHEIRNPLTSIKGFVQLAATREGSLSPDQLDIIIQEADHIESIIKETMMLAKPAQVKFKPVNLEKLFHEIQALIQPQMNLKGVELLLKIEKDLPIIIGEPNHLKQVFVNLIKNSIEAIPETGGKIIVEVKNSSNQIVIMIQDNGCGIPADILANIGNPFVSTKENGTGLGLTVSYRIIQNHGGKISVHSILGRETTFTVELPNKEPL